MMVIDNLFKDGVLISWNITLCICIVCIWSCDGEREVSTKLYMDGFIHSSGEYTVETGLFILRVKLGIHMIFMDGVLNAWNLLHRITSAYALL